jgi:uncharacterized cupredoxin-like copper-binding protein
VRLILLAVAALLAAGCADRGASVARGAAVVRVSERDFRISAPASVRPGPVRFSVGNRGPVAHELIVVKAGDAPLPLRRDGLTVDEDAVEARTAVALEPQPGGSVSVVRAHLGPGRYVLFCNMSGHYLAGMRRELVVR